MNNIKYPVIADNNGKEYRLQGYFIEKNGDRAWYLIETINSNSSKIGLFVVGDIASTAVRYRISDLKTVEEESLDFTYDPVRLKNINMTLPYGWFFTLEEEKDFRDMTPGELTDYVNELLDNERKNIVLARKILSALPLAVITDHIKPGISDDIVCPRCGHRFPL